MSAFLGYIHHLMWGKINFVEDLVDVVINQASLKGLDIKSDVDSIGTIESGDLAEIIDHANIHGWLSQRVETSEQRLAKAVQLYLKAGTEEELQDVFYKAGTTKAFEGSKAEAYQNITSSFLDGMPCDGSLRILAQEDDIQFEVANDVHKHIWEEYAGVDLYWKLRDAYIRGMLINTNYSYEKDGSKYTIRG